MTGLLILLLFVLAAIYGLFFLFFKLIWLLFKKHKNKWPLILAGISTFISCLLVAGLIAWGVGKLLSPFRPLQQRIESNPQPRYETVAYTDPVYNFSLQLPEGVDYSEWISFPGVETKLGINTNLFKKDAAGKKITEPVTISAIVRQTQNVDTTNPFGELEAALTSQQDRRFNLEEYGPQTINGMPGYYIHGTMYTNRGPFPVWLKAIYKDGVITYVFASTLSENEISFQEAKSLVDSLQLP
ncbi:phage holin family protein [Candidatus Avelusimicrobium luingense]|uniref:phage holin family protein n=1 Tax=Candidatus Avelusimicrobium luingense TaxID=3416211 RepID=UPI003D1535EE